jgi:hypothetical protein
MKTCKRCGVAKPHTEFGKHRETADGLRPECNECRRQRERDRRLADPETLRAKDRERGKRERARRNATALKWARQNPDKRKASKAAWDAANQHKRTALAAKRRGLTSRATPPWADLRKIDEVYAEAAAMRALGVDVHVDHIIPLQGKTVTGLHVHTNLRLLLAGDNIAKGNRHWPDQP